MTHSRVRVLQRSTILVLAEDESELFLLSDRLHTSHLAYTYLLPCSSLDLDTTTPRHISDAYDDLQSRPTSTTEFVSFECRIRWLAIHDQDAYDLPILENCIFCLRRYQR